MRATRIRTSASGPAKGPLVPLPRAQPSQPAHYTGGRRTEGCTNLVAIAGASAIVREVFDIYQEALGKIRWTIAGPEPVRYEGEAASADSSDLTIAADRQHPVLSAFHL